MKQYILPHSDLKSLLYIMRDVGVRGYLFLMYVLTPLGNRVSSTVSSSQYCRDLLGMDWPTGAVLALNHCAERD